MKNGNPQTAEIDKHHTARNSASQPENRAAIIDELNLAVANLQVFQFAMRNFHWNIQGEQFFDLHTQFERLYKKADELTDMVAERIKFLGYYPLSRLDMILRHAQLEEPDTYMEVKEMMKWTLESLKSIIRQMTKLTTLSAREWQVGTTDMLSGMIRELETESWKWRSMLK